MSFKVDPKPIDRPLVGIAFIIIAVIAISINDMLIKQLSDKYPLHELVFARSMIAILIMCVVLQFEGGWQELKTKTPFMHAVRGMAIVISNMAFFTAIAAISLAEATALFFVAPLMITLLAIPVLGEKVGPRRIAALVVGFVGVIIMLEPWAESSERAASIWVLLLPILAAFTYALTQVLTRKLGVKSKASAMVIYIQAIFLIVSALFFFIAGEGQYATKFESNSMQFLFRAWVWPTGNDIWLILALGVCIAVVGYTISQAYRIANAATIAPFEYVGLPMAILWGWLFWGDLPGLTVVIGIALIVAAGLFVFWRERQK